MDQLRLGEYRSTAERKIHTDEAGGKLNAETTELGKPLVMSADYAKMSSTLLVGAPGHCIKPFGLILLGYALGHRGQILWVHPAVAVDQGIYLVALIFSSDLTGAERFQLHQHRSIE